MKAKIKIMILTLLVLFCFIMAARIRFRKLNLEDDKKIEVKTEERYDLNIPSSDMGNDIMSEKGDSRINENPSHITRYVANNIKVDADVIEGKGSYYEYSVSLAEFPVETAMEKLLELTGVEPDEPEISDENYWCYTSKQGFVGYVDGNVFFERHNEVDDTLYSVLWIWNDRHKEERQEKDLLFMSMKDAYELVLDYIHNFFGEECEIIQMNAVEEDSIIKCHQEVLTDGEVWNVDEKSIKDIGDAYFFRIGCWKDGIPVYSWVEEQPANSVMDWDVSRICRAEAVVTKDGLRYFEMDNPYTIVEGESRKLEILSAKEAVDIASKSLKGQIISGEIVIDKVYLEYVLIASEGMWKPRVMRPYWTIEYTNSTETDGQMVGSKNAIRINAETGKDLAYGK